MQSPAGACCRARLVRMSSPKVACCLSMISSAHFTAFVSRLERHLDTMRSIRLSGDFENQEFVSNTASRKFMGFLLFWKAARCLRTPLQGLAFVSRRPSVRFVHFVHFIHIPPWVVSQGGYACGCAVCACDAGVRTRVQRAFGVCAVVRVVLLRAWGSWRVWVPRRRTASAGPNPKGRHVPTAREPHAPHTHASLPPTLRGGGLLRIPGLHRSAQSV